MGRKEVANYSRRMLAPVELFSLLLTAVCLPCPGLFLAFFPLQYQGSMKLPWPVAVTGPISLAGSGELRTRMKQGPAGTV